MLFDTPLEAEEVMRGFKKNVQKNDWFIWCEWKGCNC
jgi:hypothetical protein